MLSPLVFSLLCSERLYLLGSINISFYLWDLYRTRFPLA